ALLDRQTFMDVGRRLNDRNATFSWEYQPRPGLLLSQAQALAAQLQSVQLPPSTLSHEYWIDHFGSVRRVQTDFPFITEQATSTAESIHGSVETIALAGRFVALVVVAVAGVFWVDRRRSEVALLASRGVGPMAITVKVILEVVIPAGVAAAVGWFVARWLVAWLGPLNVVDPGAVTSSEHQVIWTASIAVAALGVVAGITSRRILDVGSERRRDLLLSTPWELVFVALAGASLYEILTRRTGPVQSGTSTPSIDRLLLLFPIPFIAAGAGLAARGLRRILPRLRSAGTRWPQPLYLAS